MAPDSPTATSADAEFDLDVKLTSVIRHVAAGAVAGPSAVGCGTGGNLTCTSTCNECK